MIPQIDVNEALNSEYNGIDRDNADLEEIIKDADFPEDYDAFDDELLDMIP